jgi:hypothetical protein
MARLLPRLTVLFSALGVAHVSFIGCGGSDEVKHARDEGGAAGEGGEKSSGGSGPTVVGGAPTAGAGGSPAGGASGGSGAANAGVAGQADTDVGGAAGATSSGTGGVGDAGSTGLGGASAEASLAGAAGAGGAACATPQTGRITIGFDPNNAEWVTNLQWLDSANNLISNVAASGGTSTCGDPTEFFGESYGAPEGTTPLIVVAGSRATSVACGSDVDISANAVSCSNVAQVPTHTEYHFYDGAKASQMRVTRTIGFDANTPVFTNTGLRVWQPRVVLATWKNVIYPNAAGTAITTKAAQSCPGDCILPTDADWNKQWFADLADDGHAIIVRRDPSMTSPVSLTVNYDAYSSANLSSFIVLQPQNGWKAPITEVEYLCFADLTSWPQAERDAATLPTWCGP